MDYLGLNQPRVLDPEDKGFESVIYQRRKPPLSCEFNLDDNLGSRHAQNVAQLISPSGWAIVGNLKNNTAENACRVGDVITSPSYTANTFKLIAYDKGVLIKTLVAWVNGWKILVQGSNNTSNENNIITLPVPPTTGYRNDFVFLEVWRKLIEPEDVIYKYGNVLYGGVNPTNDLIDPAIGIETSLRIQLQYRIRVATVFDIETYPSGFDPNSVFVQGPLSNPVEICSHAYFSSVPGDIGLWRAGAGDSAAQEALETVDGYTYAIPIFVVTRRNTDDYDPDSRSNGAGKSLTDYLNGYASDRPDNKYNDWIVADDILDMRHRIDPINNMKELCESSFQRLIKSNLRGKLEHTSLGEDHYGTILTQIDAVSNVDKEGSTKIAQGDGIRRIFSNALLYQPDTLVRKTTSDKAFGIIGSNWSAGDQVQFLTTGYPTGSIINSIDEVYISSGALIGGGTDYDTTGVGTNTVTIGISSGSSLIGTDYPLTADYTIKFINGPNGMSHLPEAFLEFRREDSTVSIASQNADIRVRQAAPVVASDGTHFNMLSNKGANTTEPYNFGHQMTYNMLGNGTQNITIPRTINGYNVLGIISILDGTSYRSTSSIIRTASFYAIDVGSPAIGIGNNIETKLYLENKLFETNKQGRAIVDTYEMRELIPLESANNILTTFTLDSTNQTILAIGSNRSANGYGIAYVDGTQTTLLTHNSGLPTDTTKSIATIKFSSAPSSGASIEASVLMKSAISSTEGYSLFYERVPYQGQLDSTVMGVIEGIGTAMTTTAGSGFIRNFTYSVGKAKFADSTTIEGIGTGWLTGTGIKSGFVISANAHSDKEFVISEVYDNDTLFITGRPDFISGSSGEDYTITGKDVSFFNLANIIDKLPAYRIINDAEAKNESISTAVTDAFPVLDTRIISGVQDFIDLSPGDTTIGISPASSGRGRYTIKMPENKAPLGLNNLGLKFEKLDSSGEYQKTYQTYILNRENEGKLYLMVIGNETGNDSTSRIFNENSNLDSVDIFELPGRPLTARRTM